MGNNVRLICAKAAATTQITSSYEAPRVVAVQVENFSVDGNSLRRDPRLTRTSLPVELDSTVKRRGRDSNPRYA